MSERERERACASKRTNGKSAVYDAEINVKTEVASSNFSPVATSSSNKLKSSEFAHVLTYMRMRMILCVCLLSLFPLL